ncbi:MAG: hypothetical protein GXP24_05650 [Planctomycetes bacterium]|nr:hypothetical protein [Planctomycetota bacterium]
MRSILLVVASFAVTILAWGLYGPVLHWGQHEMSTIGKFARLRPFICVGLAYFAIGVVVPAVLLKLKGEQGEWTVRGIVYSLAGGALGAIGALGIIMAFNFGGTPIFVMPLVFGGAPVVNSFLTIYWAKRMKEIGPIFMAGLVMVLLGAVTVLIFKPTAPEPNAQAEATKVDDAAAESASAVAEPESHKMRDFILRIASIATTILCWGAYGPVLHKGQAAMQNSRLRPLLCVGLAYFAIAVIVPKLLLATVVPEASEFNWNGTAWSLAAGAAGAIGAIGIIMAFNFGGKPVFVMPLIFGGAPVVNTLFTTFTNGLWGEVDAFFLAGLILVIAGAAMVLVFAPKSPPPVKREV